jgi:hypothetical protein
VHGSEGQNTVDCRQAPAADSQANVADKYAEAAHPAVNDLPLYTKTPVVLDSRATPSFLRNIPSFANALRPFPVVRFANKSTAQTRGQGPAVILHATGHKQLRNAIHAPVMRILLSVSDLADKQDVLFQKRHAYVLTKALPPLPDSVLACATHRNGLHKRDVRPLALALSACSAARTNVVVKVNSTITVLGLVNSLRPLFYTMSSHRDIYIYEC